MATVALRSIPGGLTRMVGRTSGGTATGGTSSIPLDQQQRNFNDAVALYSAVAVTWSQESLSRSAWVRKYQTARTQSINGTPLVRSVPSIALLKGDAGDKFRAALKSLVDDQTYKLIIAKRSSVASDYTDAQITAMVEALENTIRLVKIKNAAGPGATRATWQLLLNGASGGTPDPANANLDFGDVIATYGLKGLLWWCQAVPAVRLLTLLEAGAPDLPQTQVWRKRLEPFKALGGTQEGLEQVAAGVVFSNPLTQTSRLAGVPAFIAGRIGLTTGGGTTGEGQSPNVPAPQVIGSGIPWGTILILVAIGAVVWYFLKGRKG